MNPIQASLTLCLPLLSPVLYCIISIHLLPCCHFFCFHSPSPMQSFPTMWVLVLASLLLLTRRHLPSCPLYFILFQPCITIIVVYTLNSRAVSQVRRSNLSRASESPSVRVSRQICWMSSTQTLPYEGDCPSILFL